MPPEELRAFVRAQPFRPFRLHLTDGRHFDVQHPDLVIVGRAALVLGVPEQGAEDPFMERSMTIALVHVVSAEALLLPAKGNGQQP